MEVSNKRTASVVYDGSPFESPAKHIRTDQLGVENIDDLANCNKIRINPEELQSRDPPAAVYLHSVFGEILKPHQIEGIRFLWREIVVRQNGALLAHTMGLGKSVQTIAFLFTLREVRNSKKPEIKKLLRKDLRKDRTLLLMPPGLITNWLVELEYWLGLFNDFPASRPEDKSFFTEKHIIDSSLEYVDRIAELENWQRRGGVCFLGYSLLRSFFSPVDEAPDSDKPRAPFNEAARKKRLAEQDNYKRLLLDPGPTLVIADEAHEFRNSTSRIYKIVSQIRSKYRIGLTASPLANSLQEYLNLLIWVRPKQTDVAIVKMKQLPLLVGKFDYITEIAAQNPGGILKSGKIPYYGFKTITRTIKGQKNDLDAPGPSQIRDFFTFISREFSQALHRRDTSAIEGLLPNKTEFVIRIPLTAIQRKIYTEIITVGWKHIAKAEQIARADARTKNGTFADYEETDVTKDGSKILLTAVNFLRTLCNHPEAFKKIYYKQMIHPTTQKLRRCQRHGDYCAQLHQSEDHEETPKSDKKSSFVDDKWLKKIYKQVNEPNHQRHSNKMVVLLSILNHCKKIGDKVLLFTHNVGSLDYIEQMARENRFSFCRLDGSVGSTSRRADLKCFDAGNHDIYLISTKAGGLGLNMQRANRVIILDTDFSPMWEQQAIGRSYRMKQKKPVYVYYLMTEGSIETKLADIKHWKHRMLDILIDNCWSPRKTFRGEHDLENYRDPPVEVRATQDFQGQEFWGKDKVLDIVVEERKSEISVIHVVSEKITGTSGNPVTHKS